MKNIAIAGAFVIVILISVYVYATSNMEPAPETNENEMTINEDQNGDRRMNEEDEETPTPTTGKLKADTFTGTLEEVNTGCYVDAECYVVVDGKHVTILTGERLGGQREVGTVQGTSDGIGGLEAFIGGEVEVYAQDNSDGTYTLYGSEGFYVRALK